MPETAYEAGAATLEVEVPDTGGYAIGETQTATGDIGRGIETTHDARHSRGKRRTNNPYTTRWARYYDRMLSVPPMGKIRRSEELTLARMFEATLRPTDTLLEIGPGTGRYTVHFAREVQHVTAVEQSAEMVAQLDRRLARESITNCSVILGDFSEARLPAEFDVVALIGVMDYVFDPEVFLLQAARLARRTLLFTTPHCGMLAKVHRTCNRMRGISVSNFTPSQIRGYLSGFEVEVNETGRCSRLCRGLTLACRAMRR
jgi:protein-L-isoaspartate O-methyltransferase